MCASRYAHRKRGQRRTGSLAVGEFALPVSLQADGGPPILGPGRVAAVVGDRIAGAMIADHESRLGNPPTPEESGDLLGPLARKRMIAARGADIVGVAVDENAGYGGIVEHVIRQLPQSQPGFVVESHRAAGVTDPAALQLC